MKTPPKLRGAPLSYFGSHDRYLIAVVGPTAVGKTDLVLRLNEHLPLEAVAADSRTIYRWMDIATGKPSLEERRQVPHHLIDLVDPDESYSVALYQQQALEAIERIFARRHQPILVGGAGLYVRAVCDGLRIPPVPPNTTFRQGLERRARVEGPQALHDELASVDAESASRIHPQNVRRVVRALEVHTATGVPFSAWQVRFPPPYKIISIGLRMEPSAHDARIDRRIDQWVATGLVDEVRHLLDRGFDPTLTSMTGLGYREIGQFLRGELTLPAAVERHKLATRQYVRRQMSWFRGDPRITWFDSDHVTAEGVLTTIGGQVIGSSGA